MIGLVFLAAGLLWLALSWYLATRLPTWLGVVKPLWQWVLGFIVFLLLLVGPFVDHILGMRQFQKLCDERTVMQVSKTASQVTRAKQLDVPTTELPGYWIKIRSSPVVLIDADTNQEFLRYEILNTKGGRVGGLVMLGGSHQCLPKDYSPTKRLNIDKLLEQGK